MMKNRSFIAYILFLNIPDVLEYVIGDRSVEFGYEKVQSAGSGSGSKKISSAGSEFEKFGPDDLYLRVRTNYNLISIRSPTKLSDKYIGCASR
jgi:hypothetical protein